MDFSLLIAHFLGDFVLQTDAMATRKSKEWLYLSLHCVVYALMFVPWGLRFYLITLLTHFVTDAITSRITTKLWFFQPIDVHFNINNVRYECWIPKGGSRHYFFVMIGFDQLIHFATLALTLRFL